MEKTPDFSRLQRDRLFSHSELHNFEDNFALAEIIQNGIDHSEVKARKILIANENKESGKYVYGDGMYNYLEAYSKVATDDVKDAHEKLVLGNIRLVQFTINKHFKTLLQRVEADDLLNVGYAALALSAWRYSPTEYGFSFSTYAVSSIKHKLSDYLVINNYALRPSQYSADSAHKVRSGQNVSDNCRKQAEKFEHIVRHSRSIDEAFGSLYSGDYTDYDGNPIKHSFFNNITEQIEAPDANDLLEEEVFWSLDADVLYAAFNSIKDEREKLIIALRFGFVDGNSNTLKGIGEIIGLTTERVRQIEAKALSRLRAKSALRLLLLEQDEEHTVRGRYAVKSNDFRMQKDMAGQIALAKNVKIKEDKEVASIPPSPEIIDKEDAINFLRKNQDILHAWGNFINDKSKKAKVIAAKIFGYEPKDFGYFSQHTEDVKNGVITNYVLPPDVRDENIKNILENTAKSIGPILKNLQRSENEVSYLKRRIYYLDFKSLSDEEKADIFHSINNHEEQANLCKQKVEEIINNAKVKYNQ